MTTRLALAAVLVLLLAGCSTAPVGQPAPSPAAPSEPPAAAAAVPDIPITDGRLSAVRTPRPPIDVQIAAAEISMPVVPVGVLPDGLMELPDQVSTAGWYRYGSDPLTGSGTTVISAHVDSAKYGLGPFAKLKGLSPGTEIVVTVEGGERVRYAVESVTSFPKAQLPLAEVFDRAGAPRLALITCGGQFDRSAFRYSDNVVVIALPVES